MTGTALVLVSRSGYHMSLPEIAILFSIVIAVFAYTVFARRGKL